MGTIEYTDNNFTNKFIIINEILNEIDHSNTNIKQLLDKAKNDYDLISLNILHKYFTSDSLDMQSKDLIIINYHQEISKK